MDAIVYHFEPLLHGSSTLQVFSSGLDVPLNFFLTEIDHVAGEERFAVLLEVLLISIEHTIEPWEELFGTMIKLAPNQSREPKRVIAQKLTSDQCGGQLGYRKEGQLSG